MGLILNLVDYLKFLECKGVFIIIDGMLVKVKVEGGKIFVMKDGKRWIKGILNVEVFFIKCKGEEGLMIVVIMDCYVYVYGIVDNFLEEEL